MLGLKKRSLLLPEARQLVFHFGYMPDCDRYLGRCLGMLKAAIGERIRCGNGGLECLGKIRVTACESLNFGVGDHVAVDVASPDERPPRIAARARFGDFGRIDGAFVARQAIAPFLMAVQFLFRGKNTIADGFDFALGGEHGIAMMENGFARRSAE